MEMQRKPAIYRPVFTMHTWRYMSCMYCVDTRNLVYACRSVPKNGTKTHTATCCLLALQKPSSVSHPSSYTAKLPLSPELSCDVSGDILPQLDRSVLSPATVEAS